MVLKNLNLGAYLDVIFGVQNMKMIFCVENRGYFYWNETQIF
ncbi:hypothetical protein PEPS_02400 [Persicobacter psychrovividus]|uniref:Uncharacterized protein n=1 Tax=Persicobacter psychrovividus TaxID=387638 RepID=A0ABM7VB96_9BACT|nr:hypothetical protein PEPS_02400 [Persicobacter psychrovividus]